MSDYRLKKLLEFETQSPKDEFIIYGIALEYVQQKNYPQAEIYFTKLLTHHENYIPTYYQAAKYFELVKEFEKAKATYIKGIAKAKEFQDLKAESELKREYGFLLEDLDEE